MSAPQKRVRCPKCRKPPTSYREWWTGFSMSFDATADGMPEDEGILRMGEPAGAVEAMCACGHRWRLRGVRQITELQSPNVQPQESTP